MHEKLGGLARFAGSIWAFFGSEKDSIASLATILQTIAICAGVWLTVRELVLTDRSAERQAVARSIELAAEAMPTRLSVDSATRLLARYSDLREGRPESLLPVARAIDTTLARLHLVLLEAKRCEEYAACDGTIMRQQFCDVALKGASLAGAFDGISLRSEPGLLPRKDVYRYGAECFVRFAKEWELALEPWLPFYLDLHPDSIIETFVLSNFDPAQAFPLVK